MAVAAAARVRDSAAVPPPVSVTKAAALAASEVLARLEGGTRGLAETEAARRLRVVGPNAVRSYRARALPVLLSQLRSPLLLLLAVTAAASYFVGERGDALIIGIILAASVGLGFANEYRAEKAAEALHSQLHTSLRHPPGRASRAGQRDRTGLRRCRRAAARHRRAGGRAAAVCRRAGVRRVGADR